MSTGFYLLDHPPARAQFYDRRNAALTGGVAVHTTESIIDTVTIDTGAENVAAFIARRGDAGSYHVLVDSDSTVPMVPDSYTAFHIAASGHNSRTWGIAFACRTTDLDPDHPWTRAAFKRAAVEIVGFWRRNRFPVDALNTWLAPGETLTRGGLFHHGTAQPRDRTDAFAKHPRRAELAALLSREITTAAGGNLTTEREIVRLFQEILVDDGPGRPGAAYLTTVAENDDHTFTRLPDAAWLDPASVDWYKTNRGDPKRADYVRVRSANLVELAGLVVGRSAATFFRKDTAGGWQPPAGW